MASGLLLSRLMKAFNLPNVTGYLVGGILVGPFVADLIHTEFLYSNGINIILNTALGFIAFSIGGEFQFAFLKKLGRKIIVITILEALSAVALVTLGLLLVPAPDGQRIPRALLLGAIAAATAPAATLLVIRQYRAKGPLTSILLAVTAIDDAIGLIVYSIMAALAAALLQHTADLSFQTALLNPLGEIGLSLALGGLMGILLAVAMCFFRSNENRLALIIMSIFACIAISKMCEQNEIWKVSPVLACMMLSAVFVNLKRAAMRALELCEHWTPALFMIFFVLSGAKLDFAILKTVGIASIVYLIARSAGKYFGAYIGATISHTVPTVRNYLGVTLLPQAGVAIGMVQLISSNPALSKVADSVITVALFATLIYELVGPLLTAFALERANEITYKKSRFSRMISRIIGRKIDV